MNFMEALEAGATDWDSYRQEFDSSVSDSDWVLVAAWGGPLYNRVLFVFNEDFLEMGESIGDRVAEWEIEARDTFSYYIVEDFKELIESELLDPDNEELPEDDITQYWEDERWRDDL